MVDLGAEEAVPLDDAVRQQRASDSIRDISRYQYWSQRLIAVHGAMVESKPHTIQQWWYDDRDNQQRTTVLVAVVALLLTALFSLVQTILTGLQLHQGNQSPQPSSTVQT